MAECRNPECRDRYTPGVITSGKGTANAPVIGATMRWGWVNCRACNPKDKDPAYQHIHRSSAEIQERARLADSKAAYVHQAPAQRSNLEAIAAKAPAPSTASAPASTALVERLLAANEKLSDQISALLEENRALRNRSEDRSLSDGPPRVRKIHKKTRKSRGVRNNGSDSDEE